MTQSMCAKKTSLELWRERTLVNAQPRSRCLVPNKSHLRAMKPVTNSLKLRMDAVVNGRVERSLVQKYQRSPVPIVTQLLSTMMNASAANPPAKKLLVQKWNDAPKERSQWPRKAHVVALLSFVAILKEDMSQLVPRTRNAKGPKLPSNCAPNAKTREAFKGRCTIINTGLST